MAKVKVIGNGFVVNGIRHKINDIVEVNDNVAEYYENNKPKIATTDLNSSISDKKEVKSTETKELKRVSTKTKQLIK